MNRFTLYKLSDLWTPSSSRTQSNCSLKETVFPSLYLTIEQSISDISKRMTTKSHVREQSSTSVPNPPKLTNTESTNNMVDGYSFNKLFTSLRTNPIFQFILVILSICYVQGYFLAF